MSSGPRTGAILLAALVACAPLRHGAGAGPLRLDGYREGDGAVTLYRGGDLVDPYFATKALLAARAAGADVRRPAAAWVEWAMPRQLPDGRLERHCRARAGAPWARCWDADADDAMLALWLELLHALAPDRGLSESWRASADAAERHLASLLDPALGVYRVSLGQPAALFMDNVEIYGALSAVARERRRFGDLEGAARAAAGADSLAAAIVRTFWRPERGMFAISTQEPVIPEGAAVAFYPHVVAQLYPWMAALPAPPGADPPPAAAERWLARYGERWLSFREDHYPWGLAALAFASVGDAATAQRWRTLATPLRDAGRWNVLEEGIWEALAER